MANTASWPIKTVEVMDVSLDTENIRLRDVEPYESDVLAYLFDVEDAFGLANDIAKDGYFDNDLPIVVNEDNKLVVLEGNRRISALRGLANPTSVPQYKDRLTELRNSLSAETLNELLKLRVIEAPGREAVQPILASLHTRNPKRPWPTELQADFYYAQLGPGVSVEDLKRRYPSAASRIPRFIRMAEMKDLVHQANLGEEALETFSNSNRFKMSVFERLYASEDFQKKLGVSFDDNGHVKVAGNQSQIDKILSQVVRDMMTGLVNTRLLGTQESKRFKEYVEGLGLSKASPSDTSKKPSQPTPATGSSAGSKAKKSKNTLDTSDIEFGLSCAALERRFRELKSINCVNFPNATMDLMRTVLECGLKQYFIEAGKPVPVQPGKFVMLGSALDPAQTLFVGQATDPNHCVLENFQTTRRSPIFQEF